MEDEKNKKLKEIKLKNKEKLKQYKKQLKSEIFDVENEIKYNENGEALIECKIGKAENIFNKYDLTKNRTVTDEFEKYLLEELEIIPMSENIALKLYVDENFTQEHERQVKVAIKKHFSFNIITDKIKIKNNIIWASLFFVLGIISLTLCSFVGVWLKNYPQIPLYECMLLLTWFFCGKHPAWYFLTGPT